jgi:hypothetical protein
VAVTSLARTALDIAREHGVEAGLVVADATLGLFPAAFADAGCGFSSPDSSPPWASSLSGGSGATCGSSSRLLAG